jgi:hypothetical protein
MIMDNGDASIYVGWTGVRQVEIGKHGGPLGNPRTSYVFFPANHGADYHGVNELHRIRHQSIFMTGFSPKYSSEIPLFHRDIRQHQVMLPNTIRLIGNNIAKTYVIYIYVQPFFVHTPQNYDGDQLIWMIWIMVYELWSIIIPLSQFLHDDLFSFIHPT